VIFVNLLNNLQNSQFYMNLNNDVLFLSIDFYITSEVMCTDLPEGSTYYFSHQKIIWLTRKC